LIAAAVGDKNFVFLLIAFTMLDSVFIALGVVLDPFFGALGFTTGQISILGAIFVVCGVISSLIFGVMLDKYRKYLQTLKAICYGTTFMLLTCYASFLQGSIWIVGASSMLIGIIIVPILPVGSAFAGELTFPMEQAVIIGML
jgi:MFS family permease